MTVVRIDVHLDPDARQGVLDALREQPDVTSVTAGADGVDLELAGYALDAARARAAELLRNVAADTGADLGAFVLAPDDRASDGALDA